MNTLIKSALSASIILFSTLTHGIFNEAFELINDAGQLVTVLAETHSDKQKGILTQEHRQSVANAALKHNAAVVVEDQYVFMSKLLSDLGISKKDRTILRQYHLDHCYSPALVMPDSSMLCLVKANTRINLNNNNRNWVQGYNFSALDTLTKTCKEQGILVKSIDIRTPMRASLTGYDITIKNMLAITDALIKQLISANDGPIAQEYYQQCINNYRTNPITQELTSRANADPTICLSNITDTLDSSLIRSHQSDLINAYLIHIFLTLKDKKHIIICTGFVHAEEIVPVLQNFNYSIIRHAGQPTQCFTAKSKSKYVIPVVELEEFFNHSDKSSQASSIQKHTKTDIKKIKKKKKIRHNLTCRH